MVAYRQSNIFSRIPRKHRPVLLFGLAILLVLCLGFAALALLLNFGQKAAMTRAIESNNGFGARENPIPAGTWINFSDANVRAARMIKPADNKLREYNILNPLPAAGMEYVMVFFEVECEAPHCNRNGTGFQLMDGRGRLYEESFNLLYFDDNLDLEAEVRGGRYDGWQVFELPKGQPVTAIRLTWANSPWLYVQPPQVEQS